jgi:hypothetical protein
VCLDVASEAYAVMLSYVVKMIKMIKMMCVFDVASEAYAVMLLYVILCYRILSYNFEKHNKTTFYFFWMYDNPIEIRRKSCRELV